jgi:hypothetical protein
MELDANGRAGRSDSVGGDGESGQGLDASRWYTMGRPHIDPEIPHFLNTLQRLDQFGSAPSLTQRVNP